MSLEKIKIVCICDAGGGNKNMQTIKCGEIFDVYKSSWYDSLYTINLYTGNKDLGYYYKFFFKTLAEHRDKVIDDIFKD